MWLERGTEAMGINDDREAEEGNQPPFVSGPRRTDVRNTTCRGSPPLPHRLHPSTAKQAKRTKMWLASTKALLGRVICVVFLFFFNRFLGGTISCM